MKIKSIIKGKSFPLALAATAMLCGAIPTAFAQIEKTLKFIPASVDFGTIREDDGRVSREVKAVNVSPDSTFIISARTSCGCSAAKYPETVMAPGDTVTVTVSYDPTNRPGKFLKTARFFTGKERIGNSLKMNGTVIPSRKNLDKAYPDKAGQLRLSTKLVKVGEMSRSEARPLFVGLYNDSDRPLAIMAVSDSEPMEAAMAPDTIEPFGIATLSLMVKGRLIPENEQDFTYKVTLIDTATDEIIVTIPVGGAIKVN